MERQTEAEAVEDPVRAARDLRAEVAKLRLAFTRRTVTLAVVAVAVIVVTAGLIVFSVLALRVQAGNNRRIEDLQQQLCPIVALMVPRPGDPPAPAGRAQLLAERATRLAAQFHCQPSGGA